MLQSSITVWINGNRLRAEYDKPWGGSGGGGTENSGERRMGCFILLNYKFLRYTEANSVNESCHVVIQER